MKSENISREESEVIAGKTKLLPRFFLRFHPWQILLLAIPFSLFFVSFFSHMQLGVAFGSLFAFSFLTIYLEVKRSEAEKEAGQEEDIHDAHT
jgi:Na+/melibiose symporter-like transporter